MDSSQRPPVGTSRAGSDADAGFERLLKDAMTRPVGAAAGSECVDAETLAAWCDGSLPPSERSFVEAHAARCTRCQDMLAVMARTVPVEAVRAPWSLRHWIMMLAPAATATAAVALWFAIEPRRHASEPPVARVAVAQDKEAANNVAKDGSAGTRTPSLADAPPPRAVPPSPAETAPPSSRDERDVTDRLASAKAVDALRRRVAEIKDTDRFPQPSKTSDLAKGGQLREREELAAAVGDEKRKIEPKAGALPSVAAPPVQERPASSPPPPPPPPAAATPAPAPARSQADATSQLAQTQQAGQTQQSARPDQAQADTQSRSFGGVAGGRGAGTLNRATLNESVDVAVVATARTEASVQWRALLGRIIQHSADKGATWATQYALDDKAVIVAGSAPSSTSAWFVGRAGLVVSTADGRAWRRVAFPEAVDLVSVLATDARTAIITAADRRVFTTTDGGASWSAGKN